jgi:IS30 family transposase
MRQRGRNADTRYTDTGKKATSWVRQRRQVEVEKYKGNRAAERSIEKMLNQGWTLQDQASRKKMHSLTTGIFTRQQIRTITFVRTG